MNRCLDMISLSISLGKEKLAIIQLEPDEEIPNLNHIGTIWSIIQTPEEISLIISEEFANSYKLYEKGWRHITHC